MPYDGRGATRVTEPNALLRFVSTIDHMSTSLGIDIPKPCGLGTRDTKVWACGAAFSFWVYCCTLHGFISPVIFGIILSLFVMGKARQTPELPAAAVVPLSFSCLSPSYFMFAGGTIFRSWLA